MASSAEDKYIINLLTENNCNDAKKLLKMFSIKGGPFDV